MKDAIKHIRTCNPDLADYLSDQINYQKFVQAFQEYLGYEIHSFMEEYDQLQTDNPIHPTISNATPELLQQLIKVYETILNYSDEHQVDSVVACHTVCTPEYFINLLNTFWQIQQSG